ncbi:MAG: repressor LexA [Candidatus Moranbacteria bacterium]|nr:repressor LexA [Candidatus Moranbacteria bacterium]
MVYANKLSAKQSEAMRFIRNRVVHGGKTPSVREIMTALNYQSPRSAALILEKLVGQGLLKKRADGSVQMVRDLQNTISHARTVNIPLVGNVACGTPILAEENIEGYFPVSTQLAKPGHEYFLLRANGDSMNRAGINDGDLVLVEQQSTADEGDKVVALIDDAATVKKFHIGDGAVVLRPQSNNPQHKPIILTEDFQIQGVVKATIPSL